VTEEVARFDRWRRRREVSPVITALVHRGSEIGSAEVARAVARLPNAIPEEELRQLAERIVARLLDVPLRQLACLPDGAVLARSAARLFDLAEPIGAGE
jgi:glutamyl-tRNA reductase